MRLASWVFLVAAFFAYAAAFRDQPRVLFALACMVAGSFVVTLIHEAGHAFTALACDWRIIAFVVRPFGLQVPNRNLAIMPRGFHAGRGGWVSTVPRHPKAGTAANWAIILAAGPVASLLLAAIAFVAAATFLAEAPPRLADPANLPIDLDTHPIVASGIAIGLGIQSLRVCLFTILPASHSGATSDGTRWRKIRTAGNDYETYAPIHWIATLLDSRLRLRDRPGWMVAEARARTYPPGDLASAMPRYAETIDIGTVLDSTPIDIPHARCLIDRFRATHGSSAWLAACDAWVAAVWEDDIERARAAIAEYPGMNDSPQMTLAAEAAIAAREGDAATARARLNEMDKEVARASPFKDLTFRDIRRYVEALLI